jgi:hypothetical protein
VGAAGLAGTAAGSGRRAIAGLDRVSWRSVPLSQAKQFLPDAMFVFNCGYGIDLLANSFKLRGIWKMHDVWPSVSGQVQQQLVWIEFLAHLTNTRRFFTEAYCTRGATRLIGPYFDCLRRLPVV